MHTRFCVRCVVKSKSLHIHQQKHSHCYIFTDFVRFSLSLSLFLFSFDCSFRFRSCSLKDTKNTQRKEITCFKTIEPSAQEWMCANAAQRFGSILLKNSPQIDCNIAEWIEIILKEKKSENPRNNSIGWSIIIFNLLLIKPDRDCTRKKTRAQALNALR